MCLRTSSLFDFKYSNTYWIQGHCRQWAAYPFLLRKKTLSISKETSTWHAFDCSPGPEFTIISTNSQPTKKGYNHQTAVLYRVLSLSLAFHRACGGLRAHQSLLARGPSPSIVTGRWTTQGERGWPSPSIASPETLSSSTMARASAVTARRALQG